MSGLGFPIVPDKVGDTEYITGGHFVCTFHPVIIVEVKNKIGTGGADPFFQAAEYYRHFIASGHFWTNYFPVSLSLLLELRFSFRALSTHSVLPLNPWCT